MITILLEKILSILASLMGAFTTGLATIKSKLEGISDLIIRNIILTETDTIEFNTDLIEKLCKCDISFSYIQGGTGTPSPENVRNISGYDTLNVSVLESHDPQGFLIKEIDFNNTVYVGNIDIINGSGKITHAMCDLSAQTFSTNQTGTNTYEVVTAIVGKKNGITNILSNMFEQKGYADDGNYGMRGYTSSNAVAFRFPISEVSTPQEAKDFLVNNGVQLLYELATPIDITTTPEDITTIEGENKISTNRTYSMADINTTGIEICYFETVNNYFKNKE